MTLNQTVRPVPAIIHVPVLHSPHYLSHAFSTVLHIHPDPSLTFLHSPLTGVFFDSGEACSPFVLADLFTDRSGSSSLSEGQWWSVGGPAACITRTPLALGVETPPDPWRGVGDSHWHATRSSLPRRLSLLCRLVNHGMPARYIPLL